ncbi:MAG TPA: NTP transferase domain-containing protein [Candidatus Nanoarchaeia archaeon]|nr:NTP transferase domain-containing protein [Candidatus Nanoarchaeia archaeon]
MDRTAIIIAENLSQFDQDIALLELNGKPLIRHVVDVVGVLVNEIVVVIDKSEREQEYEEIVGGEVKFAINPDVETGALTGAVAGLEAAQGKHSVLLSADMPFISPDVIDLFFELCQGKTAVIPRWPDEQIEPLQAVFHTKSALEAAHMALEEGKLDLQSMIDNLGGVRYVSTLVVQELSPELKTFFKVKGPVDLKLAETLAKPRRTKHINHR